MAGKINKNLADVFASKLDETNDWQTEINLRKFVEESFFSIEKAVEKKATWKQIAEKLQEVVGDRIEIKPDTLRQYYGDAVKKKDKLLKDKRRRTRKKGTLKKNSANKNATTISKSASDLPVSSIQESAQQQTSFRNVRPRPNQSTNGNSETATG